MYGGIYGLVKLTSGGAKEEAPAPVVTGELSTEVAIAHHTGLTITLSRAFTAAVSGGGGSMPSFEDEAWSAWSEIGNNLALWEASMDSD
jgi:hypothetical protein